jgi:hypothetical protein
METFILPCLVGVGNLPRAVAVKQPTEHEKHLFSAELPPFAALLR